MRCWWPRRFGAPVVLAIAASTLAACSGAERLSVGEFSRRANEECTSLEQASNAFRKAQDPTFTGAQVRRFVHEVADRLRELVEDMDVLVPPETLEDDFATLLELLSDYADGLDELADRTKQGQTFQDVLDQSTGIVNRLNELATRATILVGDLGLAACVVQL